KSEIPHSYRVAREYALEAIKMGDPNGYRQLALVYISVRNFDDAEEEIRQYILKELNTVDIRNFLKDLSNRLFNRVGDGISLNGDLFIFINFIDAEFVKLFEIEDIKSSFEFYKVSRFILKRKNQSSEVLASSIRGYFINREEIDNWEMAGALNTLAALLARNNRDVIDFYKNIICLNLLNNFDENSAAALKEGVISYLEEHFKIKKVNIIDPGAIFPENIDFSDTNIIFKNALLSEMERLHSLERTNYINLKIDTIEQLSNYLNRDVLINRNKIGGKNRENIDDMANNIANRAVSTTISFLSKAEGFLTNFRKK
ncbi:hypothetical protein, partial [Deinococcus marmoris]|uniref:hypothetical protein n=1 Tax=Deinococcus marmoris TaxID=249408 RepID=UPI0015896BA6